MTLPVQATEAARPGTAWDAFATAAGLGEGGADAPALVGDPARPPADDERVDRRRGEAAEGGGGRTVSERTGTLTGDGGRAGGGGISWILAPGSSEPAPGS